MNFSSETFCILYYHKLVLLQPFLFYGCEKMVHVWGEESYVKYVGEKNLMEDWK